MPLPFILGAAALAAAGYGAKKAYDGYEDKTLAEEITQKAQSDYQKAEKDFQKCNTELSQDLENLGQLQLQIGQDFGEFRRLAEELLEKLNQSRNHKDLEIKVPKHRLAAIKKLELSTATYLGQVALSGVGGAAAAYAVYGGVMAFAAASTGTSIAALSGAAAYNATLAAIGGGSLAAGGFGMAGGAAILGGVVLAPVLAIAGLAYASHAEKALEHARDTKQQVHDAIEKIKLSINHLNKTRFYVNTIYLETERIYDFFQNYFNDLKDIHIFLENGGKVAEKEVAEKEVAEKENAIIEIIGNGYAVAAILTDIITTPLFKVKADDTGTAILDENGTPQIETDENGMQILNELGIQGALNKAKDEVKPYDSQDDSNTSNS